MKNKELNLSEYPMFDKNCGWYAITSVGIFWEIFRDFRQMDKNYKNEAIKVVKTAIQTKNPSFGTFC